MFLSLLVLLGVHSIKLTLAYPSLLLLAKFIIVRVDSGSKIVPFQSQNELGSVIVYVVAFLYLKNGKCLMIDAYIFKQTYKLGWARIKRISFIFARFMRAYSFGVQKLQTTYFFSATCNLFADESTE
jgi:hypothetical protein